MTELSARYDFDAEHAIINVDSLIEFSADAAKDEIEALAQKAQMEIAHRFSFINRSLGQRKRYAKAQQLRTL